MGRKKGKQRGQYSSKAKKAQHLTELNQHVNDTIHQEGWQSHKRNSKSTSRTSELAKFQRERSAVSVSVLRGMIRERLFEDRERDAVYRRQIMTASITNQQQQGSRRMKRQLYSASGEKEHKPIGWSLLYDHREAMAGIEQPKDDDICAIFMSHHAEKKIHYHFDSSKVTSGIQSLQLSSIYALAPFIQQYIDSCGEEHMIERLSLLPSHVITALSICCRSATDQIIYIMTKQIHVEALVFQGYSSSDNRNDNDADDMIHEYDMKPDERSNQFVSGTGFYLFDHDKEYTMESAATSTIDSWEEYQINEEKSGFGHYVPNQNDVRKKCLQRLELRNLQLKNTKRIISYLQQNPQLTHLCMSESFNAISGPQILFCHDKEMVQYGTTSEDEGKDHYFDYDGITIVSFLEKLQFLDLSGCTWVNFDLLYLLLRRIRSQYESSHLSLEMIIVGRCCSYLTEEKIAMLNTVTGRKTPFVCSIAPSP